MRGRLARLLLPPPWSTPVTDTLARTAFVLRGGAIALAILLDVCLYIGLRDVPLLRPDALGRFAAINVSLLTLDLLLAVAFLRRPGPAYRPALYVSVFLDVLTIVVWVQTTGSVSSYFISFSVAVILLYRGAFDYWTGLSALASASALHLGAFAGEELGWLEPAPLFAGPPGAVYAVAAYRVAAMVSIVASYAFAFLGGGYFEVMMAERDRALSAARRDLLRLADRRIAGRLAGTTLPGYRLAERIGLGGMGEVYRAHRISDNREVAIKILHSHLAELPLLVARFSREAELVARLPRQFVPELIETGRTREGEPFIVMELLEGGDLAARLGQVGVLSPAEACELMTSLGAALDAAHDLGVVHRDLKPQNVFVPTPWQVRLLDFGISRLQEGTGLTGTVMTQALFGSPGYLAPEAVNGARVGPHTDVFAAGAILYRALTGQDAFPARSPAEAIYEALHRHPPPPSTVRPELPPAIDAVLALALAKRPEDRYPRARMLAHDLVLAVAGQLPAEVRARAAALAADDLPKTVTLAAT